MRVWSNTRKGGKPFNEDFVLQRTLDVNRHLFIIADGMGGYENGHKASEQIAINLSVFLESQKTVNERSIQVGINKANLLLRQEQNSGLAKSGATIGGIYFEQGSAIIFWVGDVRIRHIRNEQLVFENKAHSLISTLRENGFHIDSEVAAMYKHIVLHSIQGDVSRSTASFHFVNNVREGVDTFIICSDGFEADDLLITPPPEEIRKSISDFLFSNEGRDDDGSILVVAF